MEEAPRKSKGIKHMIESNITNETWSIKNTQKLHRVEARRRKKSEGGRSVLTIWVAVTERTRDFTQSFAFTTFLFASLFLRTHSPKLSDNIIIIFSGALTSCCSDAYGIWKSIKSYFQDKLCLNNKIRKKSEKSTAEANVFCDIWRPSDEVRRRRQEKEKENLANGMEQAELFQLYWNIISCTLLIKTYCCYCICFLTFPSLYPQRREKFCDRAQKW